MDFASSWDALRSFLPAARPLAVVRKPLLVGVALWIGCPTVVAYQDMTSLVSGQETASVARWSAFVRRSAAGSIHAAEIPFVNADASAPAVSGGGVAADGIGLVALRTAKLAGGTPDESRVTREDKQGRVTQIVPLSPPKNFSAGSIYERTSGLTGPADAKPATEMAFAKSAIAGKEQKIASSFHPDEEKSRTDPGIPPQLAALVTNHKADVLATAYAPAEPDYAKVSPFESLLRGTESDDGRFVPPLEDGDHAWMATPLPPSVFGEVEQACLATGIYFEARGESLRGQAAVAQVILNRVRNPAYPKTICGVVYQNKNMKNACQFSFACDGVRDVILNPFAYSTAKDVAMAVTAGKIFIPEIGSSTHYYANTVHPTWARTMEKMKQIGRHIFFRTYGGGWS